LRRPTASQLRAAVRPRLAAALWPAVRPFRAGIERARDGTPLLPGITALVAARDEAYTIPFSLRSLVGFADQIVCIDNGSEDATLAEMESFRDEYGDRANVEVVSLPGALVGECWEAGLDRTRHQWFSPWDADMVAKTTGQESILGLRERMLRDDRHRTVALPTTNLFGDLRHVLRLNHTWDPGEPKLFRFGRGIRYREFGRYFAVRLPLHYIQVDETAQYFSHLAGIKSDENLMHRFHYWEWRETVNREGEALDPELRTLDGFKRRRNEELFGTNEPRSLKFRFIRQLSYQLMPYDEERFGAYPEVLKGELSRRQRFEVVYRDGRPWSRIDREDAEMVGYEPTVDDVAWDPEEFLRRFLSNEQCHALGIEPAGRE
jgi:glycosyltransferase involved in cell wall biosynthesis